MRNKKLIIVSISLAIAVVIANHFRSQSETNISVQSGNKVSAKATKLSGPHDDDSDFSKKRRRLKNLSKNISHLLEAEKNDDVNEEEGSLSEEEKEIRRIIAKTQWKEMRFELAKAFDAEPANSKWTSEVESGAYEVLNNKLFQTSDLESVDCRMSLCKVVFTHPDESSRKEFQLIASDMGPWGEIDSHGFPAESEDGGLETIIYFSNSVSRFAPFEKAKDKIASRVRENLGNERDSL